MARNEDTTEVWLPISVLRYAHLYSVSSLGRVRSERRIDPNRRSARVLPARILNPPVASDGYRRFILIDDGDRRHAAVHALVAEAFLGAKPPGHTVDHINGVKTDNRAANLRYLTPRQNTRAASTMGLMTHGERHHSAVLTENEVREIRRRAAGGQALASLAREYGVTPRAIKKLVLGLSWRHVD